MFLHSIKFFMGTKIIYFSSGHVWMWELNYKESWALKNWCFWTVVLEKTLESPLGSKEIQPVHPKGNQFWIFTGRTDAKAETPILWPPSCEELTHWKRLWCWEGLRAGREGDDRGWDGWMASLTWWTLSLSELREMVMDREAGVLRFMGPQRVGHDWATELNWTEAIQKILFVNNALNIFVNTFYVSFSFIFL